MIDVPAWLPAGLQPQPARLVGCQILPNAEPHLRARLGCGEGHTSLGFVTADQDDSTYAALDHATKFARVDVVYAKSFYAGAAHASGPLSGEILGVLAGPDPDEVAEGLAALRDYLDRKACFYMPAQGSHKSAFFPHVISETGQYLSRLAGIAPGEPLAYLIAPPIEAMVAIDAALKAADVELKQFFGPPTETNFAGVYLTGALYACEAAAAAFAQAVVDVARSPLAGSRRVDRARG